MASILLIVVSNVLLAAVLAILALVVSRLWKNQHVAHLLWVIVLIKFVTPPLWSVPIPVAGLIPTFQSDGPQSLPKEYARESSEQAAVIVLADSEPIETVSQLSDDPPGSADSPTADTATTGSALVETAALAPETAAAAAWDVSLLSHWSAMLTCLWLASSATCSLVVVARVVRFHRLARRGEAADTCLARRVALLAKRLRLCRIPYVRLLDAEISPMVWPLARRRLLLLPRRLVAELTPAQMDTVIAHELAHLVRRDELVRLLESVVTCLFWWNPVVWLARRELRAAEEDCCDALVVCSLPESRQQYGEALLRAAEMVTFGRSLPALASAFGQQRFLKRRIAMILGHKFQRSASWPAKLALLMLSLAVLPLAATAMSQQDEAPAQQVADGSNAGINNTGEVTFDLLGIGGTNAASLGLDSAGVVTDAIGGGVGLAASESVDTIELNPAASSTFDVGEYEFKLAQAGISPKTTEIIFPQTTEIDLSGVGNPQPAQGAANARNVHSEAESRSLDRLVPPEFKSGWEVYEFPFDATQQMDKLTQFRNWMNATPQANRTRVEVEASRRKLPLKKIELNPTLDAYPAGPVREAALPLKNGEVSDPIPYGKLVLLVRRVGGPSNSAPMNPSSTVRDPNDGQSSDIEDNSAPMNPSPTVRGSKTAAPPALKFQIMRFRSKPGNPDPSVWGQANAEAIQKYLAEHPHATPREIGQRFNEMKAGFASVSVTDGIALNQLIERSLRASGAEKLKPGKTLIVFLGGQMVLIRHATTPASKPTNESSRFGTDSSRFQTDGRLRPRSESDSPDPARTDVARQSGRFNRSAAIAASFLQDMTAEQTKLITQFVAAQSPTLSQAERQRTIEWFRREWTAKGFAITPAIEWLLRHVDAHADIKIASALAAASEARANAHQLARDVEAASGRSSLR